MLLKNIEKYKLFFILEQLYLIFINYYFYNYFLNLD